MAQRFWPGGNASVILLPSGEQGAAVFERAEQWTEMGLLGPALWVLPERVSVDPDGPPVIGAIVLGVGQDQQLVRLDVDLFEILAREELRLVRMVKLRSASPSRAQDAEQDRIGDVVAGALSRSMPMATPTTNVADRATDLARVTLICAPTEFQLRERVDWAVSGYGTVVVASPEDRSNPWSGDAFVRDNERFVGFALMHLASVAGLWSGVEKGTLELFPNESAGRGSIWVSRVFVNAVLTESLGRRTAADVLAEAGRADSLLIDPSVGTPPEGTFYIDDGDVASFTAAMVDAVMSLDGAALAFHPPAEVADPPRRRIGIGAQLGSFFSFSADKLAGMPRWSWRWLTSSTARSLTRRLHGDDGTHIVGEDLDKAFDLRDRLLIAERDRVVENEHVARAMLAAPVGAGQQRTTPRLWTRLRELVFGALDGSSDLSDLGFAEVEGKVPVFGRVSDVFEAPDQLWTPPAGSTGSTGGTGSAGDRAPGALASTERQIGWHAIALEDPRGALVQTATEQANNAEQAGAQLAVARRKVAELEHQREAGEWQSVLDGAITTAIAESENGAATETPLTRAALKAEAAPDAAQPAEARAGAGTRRGNAVLEAAISTAAEQLLAAEEHERMSAASRAAAEDAIESFDVWAARHERSFVWRMLSRMASERASAQNAAEHFARGIDTVQVQKPGALITLRKRFHLTMLVGWLVIAALAALLILLPIWVEEMRLEAPWYPNDPTIFTLAAIAAIVLTVIALASYHRGWSQFQRRIDLAQAHLTRVAQGSAHARGEVARLASLHRQTVDWLVLLARGIHQPWLVPEEWQQRPSYGMARDSMPFAMQIGQVQDEDHAAATRLKRMTKERLVVRGWRQQAFTSLIAEVAAELGQASASFALAALDEDLPHSSNHTREMLRENMGNAAVLKRVAEPRLRELMTSIQRSALHGSRPLVHPVGDNPLREIAALDVVDGIGEDVPWDDFLLGSLVGRRDPVTPLSAVSMSERHVQEGHHEQVRSMLVLPERLEPHLEFRAGAPVSLIPYGSNGGASIDLVWRVDMAGPLPVAAIRLWDSPADAAPAGPAPRDRDSGV